jgi:hypothetical protein
MNVIASYKNGNTDVIIYDDGTKVREVPDNELVVPLFPESIDVKITNWCDGGCSHCHEKSTQKGYHADLNRLVNVLLPLPKGVELALGGGDPTSHPELIPFLIKAKDIGWIVNITINHKHLKSRLPLIKQLITRNLIHGIGISFNHAYPPNAIEDILKLTNNVVFHLIVGVNSPQELNDIQSLCLDNKRKAKVLLLGYKQYGFGLSYYDRNKAVETCKQLWHQTLAKELNREGFIFSFDNLAINQLDVKRVLTNTEWKSFYMGNDGSYTMYVDAVEQMFALTSTSDKRVSFDVGILNFFSNKGNIKHGN